jgi:formamidopyrimidine-DNA glycosylase
MLFRLSLAAKGRESLAQAISRLQSITVPELPDLTIVAEALHASLAGRSVRFATAQAPLAVRGTPAELAALSDQAVRSIRRQGECLLFELERDRVAIKPMLTGRFELDGPGDTSPAKTAVVFGVSERSGSVPADAAEWTVGGAWLPAPASEPEVRYRDPSQMGKVYVLPAGIDRPVPGLGPPDQGPDADDPELTLESFRARIRRHPGELKNLLRNQAFIAGIGNAYSDEILHAARLLPFRKRSTLATEEVDALYAATRTTLSAAIGILRARVPPKFETQVRDFLAVHLRGGQPCPRCGTRITEVSPGGVPTSYCRGCQR